MRRRIGIGTAVFVFFVLSSSAIKEPRTLTFRRVWCPEDFG